MTKCVHKHNEDCYLEEAKSSVSNNNATSSNAEEQQPENCDHVCSEENNCITKKLEIKLSARA